MSDIFEEVNEEVRRDQFVDIWKRFGVYIVTVVVAIAAAIGGNEAWKGYQASVRQEAGLKFAAADKALQTGDLDAGIAQMVALADQSSNSLAALAYMRAAAALADDGQANEAITQYDAAARAAGTDAAMRDLALLKAANVAFDMEAAADVQTRLLPLSADGAPYRLSALELLAVLDVKQGAVADARQKLQQIADDVQTSAAMRQRVTILLDTLGSE